MARSLISAFKELVEISYWKYRSFMEGSLSNSHYEFFYTSFFNLSRSFYTDKRILDIGCGPRGSLEWATMAAERIGVDPLADKYLKLGAARHSMTYTKAYLENLPFPDNHFDVVCSFNSLDHVEDLRKSALEISRVVKQGGLFLLIVDIHNYPTPTEPLSLQWDLLNTHFSAFEVQQEERLRSTRPGRIYFNARSKVPLDQGHNGNGLLVAKLKKR